MISNLRVDEDVAEMIFTQNIWDLWNKTTCVFEEV